MIDLRPIGSDLALHAVRRWHYAQSWPGGAVARYGAYEHGRYIGAIVFATGANPNIGDPYGLSQPEVCELVRVAFRDHETPTTQYVARALRLLKQRHPGRRLVISYADPGQGHHGGIYQAGNWLYLGQGDPDNQVVVNGRRYHKRSASEVFGSLSVDRLRNLDPESRWVIVPGKHKYAYPLDRAMRRIVTSLARPYPAPTGEAARSIPGLPTSGATEQLDLFDGVA